MQFLECTYLPHSGACLYAVSWKQCFQAYSRMCVSQFKLFLVWKSTPFANQTAEFAVLALACDGEREELIEPPS